ncbi:MAG: RNA polymerase sigma-70 factor (ECF subfamily) [Paraglaciecola sp.]|jgi:RNA polymerase sigma-70 factor (ECF subfamily)
MNTLNFNQQFLNLTQYLRALAFKMTKDQSMAEDLFQDTAFLAFKNKEKFALNTNMKGWLGTIMYNAFITQYRKKKVRNELFDNTTNHYYLNAGKATIQNDGEGKVTMSELTFLIDELDDKFKKPFLMAHEGYKYDEICEVTNAALGTVKSRIFLARKALKNRVIELYGEHYLCDLAA